MAIWFDMTWSLVEWNAGVTGIVRAELELAKQIKKIDKNLRICVYRNDRVEEINDSEMDWLWNSHSVVDAYIEHFGRQKKNVDLEKIRIPEILEVTRKDDAGRIIKIIRANDIIIKNTRAPQKYLLALLLKTIELPLRLLSKIHLARQKKQKDTSGYIIKPFNPTISELFSKGDILFTCGWITMEKRDDAYEKIRLLIDDFKLVYFVYDLILVNDETKHLYAGGEEGYKAYLRKVSRMCDKIIYGGETALLDTKAYFGKRGWRFPEADFIKFGSNIIASDDSIKIEDLLEKYHIDKDYIMMVGTIDEKKNQDVLYRAYNILNDEYNKSEYPQLVLVAALKGGVVIDNIRLNPKIKDRIIIINPSDSELDCLYKNCKFIVLSTLYEGWSLTLPEGLSYGKLCIVSDVRPLREVGKDLCVYVDPYDSREWANKIVQYYNNVKLLNESEKSVLDHWKSISWEDAGKELYARIVNVKRDVENNFCIGYDISLVFWAAYTGSGVSGITRAQLMMARKLYQKCSNIKFFSLYADTYVEVSDYIIKEILDENYSIDEAVLMCKERVLWLLNAAGVTEKLNKSMVTDKYAIALLMSVLPIRIQDKLLSIRKRKQKEKDRKDEELVLDYELSAENIPFDNNMIIFSAGTGYGAYVNKMINEARIKKGVKFCQLIYDFTPSVVRHTHLPETVEHQELFWKNTYSMADAIFYGGKTAMDDGLQYAKERGYNSVDSRVIRFGSDFVDHDNDLEWKDVSKKYKLPGEYILVVGTIEARKNYDTLYLAYVKLLEEMKDAPNLVFAGYPGWKTESLLATISRDERIKDKLVICSPSDDELDLLYKNSLYCILASQYEGWSLTLPQALNYGKFVLCSDVKPIKEIAQDLVDYVPVLDTFAWKDKIKLYCEDRNLLSSKEKRIQNEWHNITWDECTDRLLDDLREIARR